ncbi:MAG: hypothetical protein ACE363_05870 [Alphaproteobacteria bacterium]
MRSALTLSLSFMLLAAPVHAQSEPVDEVEQAARAAAETIRKAIELFVDSIPQYEAPEVMPNGDIVIRRKPKPGEERQPYPYEGPCEIDSEITI